MLIAFVLLTLLSSTYGETSSDDESVFYKLGHFNEVVAKKAADMIFGAVDSIQTGVHKIVKKLLPTEENSSGSENTQLNNGTAADIEVAGHNNTE